MIIIIVKSKKKEKENRKSEHQIANKNLCPELNVNSSRNF